MSTLPPPQELPDGIGRVHRAVEFARIPGFRPLELDLYLPTLGRGRPAPLVVFLHGGGWRVGSRAVFCPIWRDRPDPFHRLVAAGLAVASVDYRLAGEAVFPAQLDDVRAAVTFLQSLPDSGFDPSRLVVWGESAGGHLAALLGLTAGPGEIAGVVDWYGPSDLAALLHDAGPDSREAGLLGPEGVRDPDQVAAASPVHHVHPGAPPFLVAHGAADRFVPSSQSSALAAALRAVDVPVEETLVPGADHLWAGASDPEAILEAGIAFVRRVGGTEPLEPATSPVPTTEPAARPTGGEVPRWKTFLLTASVILVLQTGVATLLHPLDEDWPLLARSVVTIVPVVALMVFVVMPRVSGWLRNWLRPNGIA